MTKRNVSTARTNLKEPIMSTTIKSRLTIVIDDDGFSLRLLSKQLELAGALEIKEFQDPAEAMALISRDPYAVGLVVSDIQMPKLDGVALVAELARIGYLGSLVLVSGDDEKVLSSVKKLAQGLRLSILGTLTKPVKPTDLLSLLEGATRLDSNTDVNQSMAISRLTPADLKRALGDYQLINYFQPKVSCEDGRVIGIEALARWKHPTLGILSPAAFLHLAEGSSLIDDLTFQLLFGPHGAIPEIRYLADRGFQGHVSVNLSQSLCQTGTADRILEGLVRNQVKPEMLCIEITETSASIDRYKALAELARLKLNRVWISADDFGTGHSTLTQINEIPFNEMKLDLSFVTGSSKSKGKTAILRACIQMAKELNLTTVAEGVETREDWDSVVSLGCDSAQGYFIARPMAGADLIPWLERWEIRRRSFSENLFTRPKRKLEEVIH